MYGYTLGERLKVKSRDSVDMGYYKNEDLSNRKSTRQYDDKRTSLFYRKNDNNNNLRAKSHSLDAIIEELCLSGAENTNSQNYEEEFNFEIRKSFIPRIKLTKSVSSLKPPKKFTPPLLHEMSTQPKILLTSNSANSSQNTILKEKSECLSGVLVLDNSNPRVKKSVSYNMIRDDSCFRINGTDECDKISKKSDENYFTKNFDECMKRLHLIEKEHELIEKNDAKIQFYFLRETQQEKTTENENFQEKSQSCETTNFQKYENSKKDLQKISFGSGAPSQNSSDGKNLIENTNTAQPGFVDIYDASTEDSDVEAKQNQEAISKWYSNLKKQFEKSEQECNGMKNKEMSCRIMGATLKNVAENQNLENKEKDTRHYFSRLIKSNKSLIDDELPDPDKVKNIRTMFQENLNSTLKKKLDKKLGGSLQNISTRTIEQQTTRPLSAQCNRNYLMTEVNQKYEKNKEMKMSDLKELDKSFNIEVTKRKLFEKCEKEEKPEKDLRNRKSLQPRWTDTGSVSSGISSDLSSYDTDFESYPKEGPEPETDDVTGSDDDLLEEVKNKHYVQNEILEKIRSFGTSVTYYGGEMITCSIGPLLSPTTQAIMEEITEKYKNESIGTRTFDEFYKKYVETNEPNRKKKLGRTRSFGQTDVFQKPNVLSNTDIEMYKNDLEIEIGIKKPTGIPQTGLKMKLTKSNNLGSESEMINPVDSKIPVTPMVTIDAAPEDNPIEKKCPVSQSVIITEEDRCIENVTENFISNSDSTRISNEPDEAENDDEYFSKSETENEKKENMLHNKIIKEKILLDELKTESPEELKIGKPKPENEITLDYFEHPSKEILFGYEKSLINGKRKPDIEFEKFEVGETVTEKLEKLDEVNSSGLENSKELNNNTSTINLENSEKEPEITEKLQQKAETGSRRKWNINLNEQTESGNSKTTDYETESFNSKTENPKLISSQQWKSNQLESKTRKCNQSKWPIETTVMIDIQKNNEQTPKIVTNGKMMAKTKIRLF